MAIYDKATWQLMWEMVEKLSLSNREVISKGKVLNWFSENYPKLKQSTVSAHLIKMSTNAPTRIHYKARQKYDDLFYQIDGSHFRLYEKDVDPAPIYTGVNKSSSVRRKSSNFYLQESEDEIKKLKDENEKLRLELKKSLAIGGKIHDDVLRDRVSRLGSPPLDTLIREAGVVLEDRLRSIAVKKYEYGGNLVDSIFEFGKGSFQISKNIGEQEGVRMLYRGAIQFVRNPPMHKLVDYEEETVRIMIRLIDSLLNLLSEIKPLR